MSAITSLFRSYRTSIDSLDKDKSTTSILGENGRFITFQKDPLEHFITTSLFARVASPICALCYSTEALLTFPIRAASEGFCALLTLDGEQAGLSLVYLLAGPISLIAFGVLGITGLISPKMAKKLAGKIKKFSAKHLPHDNSGKIYPRLRGRIILLSKGLTTPLCDVVRLVNKCLCNLTVKVAKMGATLVAKPLYGIYGACTLSQSTQHHLGIRVASS